MKALLVGLLVSISAFPQADPRSYSSEYPTPTVREEQKLTVFDVIETWRLQWATLPSSAPHCGLPEADLALTCPCIGFAYAEAGDLYLIRLRNGAEIDRLHLTPLFGGAPAAILQRWPADDE